jgi:PhnB protein
MTKASNTPKQKSVKAIPDGFHSVTPFLVVDQADKLIQFVNEAFDGNVTSLNKLSDGKVTHATIQIGDSQVMISEATDRIKAMPAMLYLYVEDVDSVYEQAIEAGAKGLREPMDEFYGDRSSGVEDRWGNQWWIATHTEDIDPKEMQRRQKKFYEQEVTA